ncbi:phosphatidylglycerophosphate phosphatase 1, chloroplastic/mitochondrial-like isoform X2 [Nicotiana tomentosiformis]|uniref:phosphatidylglycerophosphate phosphatase 1, chloroplastic/mitochondrial-like isoform X2 n=1 Tax=Nicotiana tomentosiformis TaxID=4098 RepID=UPI00087808C3
MQSTSVTPWHTCYYYIPKHFPSNHSLHFHKKPLVFPSNFSHIPTRCTNNSFVLSSTHNCYQEQEKHKNNSDPDRLNNIFWQEFYPSVENEKPHQRKDSEEQETAVITRSSIRTNSWWARFKAALGQRINVEGIACFTGILYKNKNLAIPHVFVPDIRYIDWAELKKRGFQGVVFDKDNTITVPYSLNLWSPLASSIEQCKSLFGDNIAVFSNSAGVKKPAGTAEEIERQFGCKSSRLIMVGDRPFTDIVYGNRNGFLTILTAPLSLSQEPLIVQQVRVLEMALVNRWSRKGIKPISHKLLPDCRQCVKNELL